MPRKPRFYLPEIPVHLVQREHSREPVFFYRPNRTPTLVLISDCDLMTLARVGVF